MSDPLTKYQFLTVWDEAVGRAGYNKRLFQEIQSALEFKGLIKEEPSQAPYTGSHWDTCWKDGQDGDRHHAGCAIGHYRDERRQLVSALCEVQTWFKEHELPCPLVVADALRT